MHRGRSFIVAAAALVVLATGVFTVGSSRADAAVAPYDPNVILSPQVFDAVNTMSTAQIQAKLDQYPNSCLRSLQGPEPKGYSTYGANTSAAQIIRSAASLWAINPQVLLVTLEKEQSLVSGGSGCADWRYWSAMGYGCPDNGKQYAYPDLGITSTCVSNVNWAGFSAQVNRGAWQLQFNRQRAEGNLDWGGFSNTTNYGFNTAGYRQANAGAPSVYYDGYATIDGTPVYMSTGVTATLYTYTPHLSANKAFYTLFTNWFGSVGTAPPSSPPGPPPTTARPVTTLPPVVPTSARDVAYVDGVYRLFMGRPASAGEKHLWGTYLAKGRSRAGFIDFVIGSGEYSRAMVADAYRTVLGRSPDAAGLAAWTDVLTQTRRDDAMYSGLAGSLEYFQKRAGSDRLVFLDRLYQDFLGRRVDAAGLSTWGAKLVDGSMNRTQVAYTVLQGREYAQRVVGKSYALVLGRWPDAPGWDYWSRGYLTAHSAAGLNASLAASAEGYAHLSS